MALNKILVAQGGGRLPASLRKEILPEGFDGILGAEFFSRHYLAFAPRRQLIAFLTSGE